MISASLMWLCPELALFTVLEAQELNFEGFAEATYYSVVQGSLPIMIFLHCKQR